MVMAILSMVIRNLNLVGVAVLPDEADTPLVIDPDAVLSLTVSREFLQPICRRDSEIFQALGSFDHLELPLHGALDVWWKPARSFSREKSPGLLVAKASDHLGS